jgi:hypothetical protein
MIASLLLWAAAAAWGVVGKPQATVPGAYDAVVMLEFPDTLCTATLISPRVLLTAAHCLNWRGSPDYRRRPKLISVWTGPDFKRSGRADPDAARLLSRGVLAAELNPWWKVDFSSGSADLALLLLAPGVSRGLRPLPLSPKPPPVGAKAWIVGYGVDWVPTRPRPGGTLSPRDLPDTVGRKHLGLSKVESLSESYFDLAGDSNICQGDSGGPVFSFVEESFSVLGVISHTYLGCSPGQGSAARVDREIPWILETVRRWEGLGPQPSSFTREAPGRIAEELSRGWPAP